MQLDGSLAFENTDHSYSGTAAAKAVPGDPLLVIRQLADQVAAHGIRRIRGRVLIDATLFSGYTRLSAGIVVSPISINDNLLDVTIGPGTALNTPATLTVSPTNTYVRFVNRVTTAAAAAHASGLISFADSRGSTSMCPEIEWTMGPITGGLPDALTVAAPGARR
jgi:D-alanyl-D-alanine carboxypeptidase/D-alanyl-D-alanine-endopeptidase (penicillin-binding protein 4)